MGEIRDKRLVGAALLGERREQGVEGPGQVADLVVRGGRERGARAGRLTRDFLSFSEPTLLGYAHGTERASV